MIFDVTGNNLDCTGYTGEYLRAILTNGDTEATCVLTNAGIPIKIYLFVNAAGEPVPQPGVPIFIKAAPDLDTTSTFFDIELTQYNPGEYENDDEELNEYWAGEITLTEMNLLPTGEKVFFSLERGAGRKRDDAVCLYIKGMI